jgi:sugar lactone lactonase YvrE
MKSVMMFALHLLIAMLASVVLGGVLSAITLLLSMTLATTSSAQEYQATIVAGAVRSSNLPSLSASIGNPSGIAGDGAGNLYVLGSIGNVYGDCCLGEFLGIVSEVDVTGNLVVFPTVQTQVNLLEFGGNVRPGPPVGSGGVAVDGSGNVFIAQSYDAEVTEVVAATGMIQTVAGNGKIGYSGDGGSAINAELGFPIGVAVDSSGNIFIADEGEDVIREVVAATGIIRTVAGIGSGGYSGDGGPATQAKLYLPTGVHVDGAGNIFIADLNNNRIREVAAATGIIQTVAGNGTSGYLGDGGPATQAYLNYPAGVFVDGAGDIFIADWANNVVREVAAATGTIETVAGNGTNGFSGDGGPATQAELSYPWGTYVDGSGNISISDQGNGRVREVSAATATIQTVAGNGFTNYSGDGGKATNAELFWPDGVALDGAGDIFIADSYNNVIREVVAATGIIQTVAGTGISGYSGDGGPATQAQLAIPSGVFVDGSGNIFIADSYNNVIRKVNAATGTIQTVAGDGTYGYSGDGGPATQATLRSPYGLFVDSAGNIFIADTGNYVVREVLAVTGLIQTVAGGGDNYGDGGPATQAYLSHPAGVFVDGAGDIFIADTGNNVVREVVATSGVIKTVAGDGTVGCYFYSPGPGGPPPPPGPPNTLSCPSGVSVDSAGNIFIADEGDGQVYEQDAATQTLRSIATGLSAPSALALDSAGDIFVADTQILDVNFYPGFVALVGGQNIWELIPGPYFQIAASPAAITVGAGETGQTTLTITPLRGFNQSVSFSCTGLPAGTSCSASSVTPNGSAVQTKLTITTTAAAAQLHPNPAHSGGRVYAMMLSGFAGLAGLISCSKRPRHRIRALGFFAVLMVSSLWMAACGGGGGGGGGSAGTPAGTYTITVKSTSGPIVNATTLTLTVQ